MKYRLLLRGSCESAVAIQLKRSCSTLQTKRNSENVWYFSCSVQNFICAVCLKSLHRNIQNYDFVCGLSGCQNWFLTAEKNVYWECLRRKCNWMWGTGELRKIYEGTSSTVVIMITEERMSWADYLERLGEQINAHRIIIWQHLKQIATRK
jgi:hypothetical protein